MTLSAAAVAGCGRSVGDGMYSLVHSMGIPKLECVMDELAVLTQRTDHGMLAQKWQHLLLRRLTLDERSDGPEVKGSVREGDLAGLLDRRGGMAAGKAQEALEHSHSLDAAGLDHGLGPGGALRAQAIATLLKSHAAPRSTPLIFSAAMYSGGVLKRPGSCLTCTAICSIRSLKIRTRRPSQRTQTSPRQVLRRHRVVGPLDLDVAVAVHRAARFVKRRERLQRQRQKAPALDVGEVLADLAARGAVDPRVGHGQLPVEQEAGSAPPGWRRLAL